MIGPRILKLRIPSHNKRPTADLLVWRCSVCLETATQRDAEKGRLTLANWAAKHGDFCPKKK